MENGPVFGHQKASYDCLMCRDTGQYPDDALKCWVFCKCEAGKRLKYRVHNMPISDMEAWCVDDPALLFPPTNNEMAAVARRTKSLEDQ